MEYYYKSASKLCAYLNSIIQCMLWMSDTRSLFLLQLIFNNSHKANNQQTIPICILLNWQNTHVNQIRARFQSYIHIHQFTFKYYTKWHFYLFWIVCTWFEWFYSWLAVNCHGYCFHSIQKLYRNQCKWLWRMRNWCCIRVSSRSINFPVNRIKNHGLSFSFSLSQCTTLYLIIFVTWFRLSTQTVLSFNFKMQCGSCSY